MGFKIKISGVLAKSSIDGNFTHVTLSLGVNLNHSPLENSICLKDVCSQEIDVCRYSREIVEQLLNTMNQGVETSLKEMTDMLRFKGDRVVIWNETLTEIIDRGVFVGLDEWGFALLRKDSGNIEQVMEGRMR